jgi:hypothetical protein
MKKFGVGQTVRDLVSNLIVICLDPNFLKSNDIVVGPGESAGNGGNAFVAILGNVFQAPGGRNEKTQCGGGISSTDQQLRLAIRISSMIVEGKDVVSGMLQPRRGQTRCQFAASHDGEFSPACAYGVSSLHT